MCVCLAPAELEKTIVYSGTAEVFGRTVHIGGYQNVAQNRNFSGGNAMILPIAARSAMGPENLLDTSSSRKVLKDMSASIPHPNAMRGFAADSIIGSRSMGIQVFEHDIYTVVLADDPLLVEEALERVPPEKRPPLAKELFEAYAAWYPGWKLMLCCFNNRNALEASPLMWWYDPIDLRVLFAPGLDCHTGNVPDLNAHVQRDHVIIFGGGSKVKGFPVRYSHRVSGHLDVDHFLPFNVTGKRENGSRYENGDYYMTAEALVEGGRITTIAPPGSEKARAHEFWPNIATLARAR